MKNCWLSCRESLYDFMLDYLNHDRCCPDCDDRLWVGYTDGHIWDKCLNCDEPSSRNLFDLAGYITDYPVPMVLLPESIEVRDMEGQWRRLEHERYYRKKEE